MSQMMFSSFPELTTERFLLRQLTLDDKPEIFILRSDERVIKYLDRSKAQRLEDSQKFIESINSGIENNLSMYWAVSHKGSSPLVGTICLWNISEDRLKADIGFELLPDHQGKGIMQEVIPAVLDYGFRVMKLQTIEGEVSPENIKSIKLMERFGFRYDRKLEETIIYTLSDN
jgi:[ribosomal protein S5]-alanine N-acetyltransferase